MGSPMADLISLSDYHRTDIELIVPDGCSQIYAPCLDPNCERDCGARQIPIIEIVDAPVVWISERVLIAAIIIFAILGGIAGHGAFDRQERAYQNERV